MKDFYANHVSKEQLQDAELVAIQALEMDTLMEENKQLRKVIKMLDKMCDNAVFNLKQMKDSHIRRDDVVAYYSNLRSYTQAILKTYSDED